MEIARTTQLGRDAEYAALFNGIVYPKPTHLILGDGTPVTSVVDRLALNDVVHRVAMLPLYGIPERVIDDASGTETVTLMAILPADFVGTIREVGIQHADGNMHRYTPVAIASNGIAKGLGYTQSFYIATLVTDEEPSMATVRFEPLDAAAMAETVKGAALAQMPSFTELYAEGGELQAALTVLGVNKSRPAYTNYLANL